MKYLHYLLYPLLLVGALRAERAQPNILFILTDDMGWGDLGCYGSTQIKTPNIDRLASGGVRFTQAYVSANVCAPSRAGILTGRYQERFGFEHNLSIQDHLKPEMVGIPVDEKLISDRLKQLGYRTGAIGKWHVGESVPAFHPLQRGFDFFFGMLGGDHDYFPSKEHNELSWGNEKVKQIRTPYLTDWFTMEAIDFMERESEGVDPWFLYLAYNTPHSPMQAKKSDLEAYAHIESPERRVYCAMQKCLDDNVGKILGYLEDKGQLESTLIIFLNDNGGSVEVSHALNAPFNGTKGTWYEGGIRVPMIWHWPKVLSAGLRYTEPVIVFDIMHSLVAAAGGEVTEEKVQVGGREVVRPKDGVNLVPILLGDAKLEDRSLYWRMSLRGGAIRKGDWKLIMAPHRPPMLFNLANDPSELTNVSMRRPALVKALYREYHDWCEGFERNPMWISSPQWAGYNDALYDRTYELKQPEE
ncbi:sulfatase [Rubritalea tangerina]|uniref:Sulfatase n=2 Tax=Rubritalea tangerina TaxID=430798 RepID=A0ABW4ZGK9_9BACT